MPDVHRHAGHQYPDVRHPDRELRFSGPTAVSLATAAFFGVGVYTSAILGSVLPLPLVILAAALALSAGALVGGLTLRLKGGTSPSSPSDWLAIKPPAPVV
jgi:hypothetical protein